MKKEIADYIERLLMSKEPLTDSQARTFAYWESVSFQDDTDRGKYRK